jgi:hypothetical protein
MTASAVVDQACCDDSLTRPARATHREYRSLRILALHQQSRSTIEAVVGGVTGNLANPSAFLLGALDRRERRPPVRMG